MSIRSERYTPAARMKSSPGCKSKSDQTCTISCVDGIFAEHSLEARGATGSFSRHLAADVRTCADVRSLLFLYTASLCTTMGTHSPHPPARLLHTLSDPEAVLICDFARRNPYGETAALGRVDPVVFSGSGKTMVVFFSTPISVSVCR